MLNCPRHRRDVVTASYYSRQRGPAAESRSAIKVVAMLFVALASVFGVLVGDVPGAPQATAACSISTNLGLGSRGDGVRCLQTTLNALGYNSGPVDGSFGARHTAPCRPISERKGSRSTALWAE